MGIGLTLQQVEGWQGQFSRMVRWRDRVLVAANGQRSPDELDFLLAFFESALHLRDWLAATRAVEECALELFFKSNVELGICRDLANGFKHHTITRPSLDAQFAIVNQYVPPNWPSRHSYPNGEWTVLADGRQFGLVELTERVVELWSRFVASQGLSLSEADVRLQ